MTDRSTVTFTDNGELQSYEETAKSKAAQKLAEQSADITSGAVGNDAIHVRDANPVEDLGVYDGPGGSIVNVSDPEWTLTTGASGDGNDSGQDNSLYAFENDADFENKAGVLYGFQFPDADETVENILATLVIETTNSTIGELDLTGIHVTEDNTVLIENPLIVGKEDIFLSGYTKSDFDDTTVRWKPLIKVAEPAGETISTSGKFADSQ
jgi:hypothetical protein